VPLQVRFYLRTLCRPLGHLELFFGPLGRLYLYPKHKVLAFPGMRKCSRWFSAIGMIMLWLGARRLTLYTNLHLLMNQMVGLQCRRRVLHFSA
jgi:hypothetical protein